MDAFKPTALLLMGYTTAERNSILPEEGMMIYNSDIKEIERYVNGVWRPFAGGVIVGPPGLPGRAGKAGPPGLKGNPGAAGTAGATGPIGPAGITLFLRGRRGERGRTMPGVRGNTGATGAAGAAGSTGAAGPAIFLTRKPQIVKGRRGPPGPAGTSSGSLDINGLTAADPALDDESPIYDISAGANRKITLEKLGFILLGEVGGRLTLTSGTSVTTSDVTAAGTIYYTPHIHNKIALYDGTRWKMYTFTERSLALTVTSGKNYDVFLYDNAGTLTLELSAAWTGDNTRADALTTQDGVQVKSGATTRRYLGTIRASGTNTVEDSAAKRFVWNMYNRVLRHGSNAFTADRSTASTSVVELNTEIRSEFVIGQAGLICIGANGSTLPNAAAVVTSGLGIDGTTIIQQHSAFSDNRQVLSLRAFSAQGIGYHYLALLGYVNTSTGNWQSADSNVASKTRTWLVFLG